MEKNVQSTPKATETLAAIGHRLYHVFRSLEVELSSLETGDVLHAALVDESQRFGLWAKNLGLYETGHSALDYRFRDAPSVYEYVRQLLVDLEDSLALSTLPIASESYPLYIWRSSNSAKVKHNVNHEQLESNSHVVNSRGPEVVFDQTENSNRIVEALRGHRENSDSDESSEEDDSYLSYQQNSISNIVLENVRLIVDRLYKLSFKIRNPTTRMGFSKARSYREIDEETGVDRMDWYASFDLRHVAEVLARYWRRSPKECENHYLVKRLASANTHRRRQFGQWRRHKLKLENVEMMLSNFPPCSEKGAFSMPSTATRLDENNFKLSDTASALSSSTYASSFTGDDENEIRIPPLPEKFYTGKEFECPYCYVLCSKRMSQKKEWE